MDKPLRLQEKGAAATRNYIAHISQADRQKERDQVLATTATDLREFSALLRKAMGQDHICALAGEEKLQEDRKLFKTVIRLGQ